jgi:hypothetical protein
VEVCFSTIGGVNHTLAANWVLKEKDSTSADAHPHPAYSPTKVFIPSQANPSNPEEMSFKETISWHRDGLDTEIGNYSVLR